MDNKNPNGLTINVLGEHIFNQGVNDLVTLRTHVRLLSLLAELAPGLPDEVDYHQTMWLVKWIGKKKLEVTFECSKIHSSEMMHTSIDGRRQYPIRSNIMEAFKVIEKPKRKAKEDGKDNETKPKQSRRPKTSREDRTTATPA